MGVMTVPQNPMTVWSEEWGKVEKEGSSYRGQGKRYLVPTYVPSPGRRGYEALRVKKKKKRTSKEALGGAEEEREGVVNNHQSQPQDGRQNRRESQCRPDCLETPVFYQMRYVDGSYIH